MLTQRFTSAARGIALVALVGTGLTAMSASAYRPVTLPAGTRLIGTLGQTVSTQRTAVGSQVSVRTTEPVIVEDLRIPAGFLLRGEVTEANDGGRVSEKAAVSIRFTSLAVDGREYPITAEPFRVTGRSETKNSLKKVIGGTVAGGVIGAITGDTKKGLLLGAIVGGGVAVATKGGHLTLPAGQSVEILLAEPVSVNVRAAAVYPQQ